MLLHTSAQIRQAVQALKLSPEARILEQVQRLFGQLDRAEEPVKPTELRRLVRLGWKAQRGEAQQDVSEFFTRCEWRTDERGLPVAASCERNSIGRARCSSSSSEAWWSVAAATTSRSRISKPRRYRLSADAVTELTRFS